MTATVGGARPETREADFPFTLERSSTDDGLTFEGYAAVFNSPTEIRDQQGEYTEIVAPGAFKRSLQRQTPVLMFNHGRHPVIGDMPLGKITDIREDARGLFVRARLSDNWLVQPVRDAIAAGAITGMSFKFEVTKDNWTPASGGKRTRTLREVRAPEVGPVVYPAYTDTTASVRSAIGALQEAIPEIMRFVALEDRDGTFSTEDPSVADLVSDAIEELWGLDDNTSDAYIIDLFDTHAVFAVVGKANPEYAGLWTVDYTYADGTVTLGTPTHPALADATVSTNSADPDGEDRAGADINDLPDSAFAYIEPGGTKDSAGRTTPRSKRHFPIHDADHVRNALARMSQSPFGEKAKPAIMAAAKKFGIDTMMTNSQEEGTSEELAVAGTSEELAGTTRSMSRDQTIRLIALETRGIKVPKEHANAC